MLLSATLATLFLATACLAANDILMVPEYVFIGSTQPGNVVCRVTNTAGLSYLWNGFTWYNPYGRILSAKGNPEIIIDTLYHTPSATAKDFWTSTLNIASTDHTFNGNYTCEVNYNNVITKVVAEIAVKGCPVGQYTCKTGGGCVPCSLVCDGLNDCGDWSDEFRCSTASSPKLTDTKCLAS